ncbi:MAG: hypothetical protein U1E29_03585, partial [Coriobacteriia bacterium]|nr:hypothetical protein [Coriobacteriia bacterium]
GEPGLKVFHLPGGDTAREAASLAHARAITRAASLPGLVVLEPSVTNDAVLGAFAGPGVRVVVGSTSADSDRARFADPAWSDQVARAIYRGVGTVLQGD